MFAAGQSAERGESVLLLEKTDQVGKKLRITGNGRCNITNTADIEKFIESYGKNGKFMYRALTEFFNNDLLEFFKKLGIEFQAERDGKVYPVKDNATTITDALIKYLKTSNVKIKYSTCVEEIVLEENLSHEKGKGKFRVTGIKTADEIIECRKVILATGGMSYPETGSTGDGYEIAKKAGHTIVAPQPALVPLYSDEPYIKDLQGVSLYNVRLASYSGSKKIGSETGDLLFTHFGISGPAALILSSDIVDCLKKKEFVSVSIGFQPGKNQKSISGMLREVMPAKFMHVFLSKAGIQPGRKYGSLNRDEKTRFDALVSDFRINITGTMPIESGIITRGGVSLKEINPYTMESKLVDELFFCGELIDIDGKTGGYNLQLAFSTAYLSAGLCQIV